MITINTSDNSNILYTVSSGKLEEADYNKLLPLLEAQIAKFKKVRWCFEMENFEGWTPTAFLQDLKMDFKHVNHVEKVAMVGEKKWHQWMSDFMKPFTPAEVKYFDISEKQLAEAWVRE